MIALVEQELDRLLPTEQLAPAIIQRAMRYSACSGGKRLRALLTLYAATLRGGAIEKALPVAAAIEMIHAYSLIHDDLPCMDDAELRRGIPANHKEFGEGMAVLAGDGLLTQAFIVLSDLPALVGISADCSLKIIGEIAQAAGTAGLIGGQVADLQYEGALPPASQAAEVLKFIHYKKTGALFRAALRSGAIVAGLGGVELAAVDTYAHNFGLAFQITDDILDVVGDSATLGKQTGGDEQKQKLTYPRLFGLDAARQMAQEAIDAALSALAVFGTCAQPLVALAEHIVGRDH